jgi:hypothetical protein
MNKMFEERRQADVFVSVYSAKLIVLGQAFGFLMLYCIAQNSVGAFGAQRQGLSNALLASCFGALQEKLLKLKVHCEKQFPEKIY